MKTAPPHPRTPEYIVIARHALRRTLRMAGENAARDARFWDRRELLMIAEEIVRQANVLLPSQTIDEDDDATERLAQIAQEK